MRQGSVPKFFIRSPKSLIQITLKHRNVKAGTSINLKGPWFGLRAVHCVLPRCALGASVKNWRNKILLQNITKAQISTTSKRQVVRKENMHSAERNFYAGRSNVLTQIHLGSFWHFSSFITCTNKCARARAHTHTHTHIYIYVVGQ
jgi:hypothetical protein